MRVSKHLQESLFCQWSDHRFSNELKRISLLLEKYPVFFDWILSDLHLGERKRDTGAKGMSAEQVLRAAILKQQNQWSYEFLELQLVDSKMSRSFVRLDFDESYSASALQANISKVKAETWQRINDKIVQYARDQGIENGRTIRMDATVVDSNIHTPSDSSLLYDCIRVASRVFKMYRKLDGSSYYPKASTKKAKKLVLQVMNAKTPEHRKSYYKILLRDARALFAQIPHAIERFERAKADGLHRHLEDLRNVSDYLPLIIDQTERRVIRGEKVSSPEKIVSIFEPHSAIIVKGKRDLAYGHKVFLTGTKSGLVTDCQLVQGNLSDKEFFMPLLDRHVKLFGKAPRQTTADGGFASEDNLNDAKELGVKDVCFSKHMGLEVEEMCKSKWVFQKLRNFRAGIESIISCLKRGYGLSRVTWKKVSGFAAYVHSSVVAYNLSLLARQ